MLSIYSVVDGVLLMIYDGVEIEAEGSNQYLIMIVIIMSIEKKRVRGIISDHFLLIVLLFQFCFSITNLSCFIFPFYIEVKFDGVFFDSVIADVAEFDLSPTHFTS